MDLYSLEVVLCKTFQPQRFASAVKLQLPALSSCPSSKQQWVSNWWTHLNRRSLGTKETKAVTKGWRMQIGKSTGKHWKSTHHEDPSVARISRFVKEQPTSSCLTPNIEKHKWISLLGTIRPSAGTRTRKHNGQTARFSLSIPRLLFLTSLFTWMQNVPTITRYVLNSSPLSFS